MANFLELVFILVSLLTFLVFARSAFGWVARAEGYSLTVETTVNDNPAVGVRFGLFLLASTGTEGVLIDDRGFAYPSAGLDRFTGRQWIDEAADATLAAHGSIR